MNRTIKVVLQRMWRGRLRTAFVALAASGLLFAAVDSKACADPRGAKTAPFRIPFDDHQSNWEPDNDGPAIVGMWNTNYSFTTPAGPVPFVQTIKQWHRDGTENENAMLPPLGGNVCFGVWKETGDGKIKLRHLGLMFGPPDPTSQNCTQGCLVASFIIEETDTVAKNGKTYTGTFTITIYDPDGNPSANNGGFPPTGTVVATRFTVND